MEIEIRLEGGNLPSRPSLPALDVRPLVACAVVVVVEVVGGCCLAIVKVPRVICTRVILNVSNINKCGDLFFNFEFFWCLYIRKFKA